MLNTRGLGATSCASCGASLLVAAAQVWLYFGQLFCSESCATEAHTQRQVDVARMREESR